MFGSYKLVNTSECEHELKHRESTGWVIVLVGLLLAVSAVTTIISCTV